MKNITIYPPPPVLTMARCVRCKTCSHTDKGLLSKKFSISEEEALMILQFLLSACIYMVSSFKEGFLKLLPSNMERLAFSHGWRITRVFYVGGGNRFAKQTTGIFPQCNNSVNKVNELHVSQALSPLFLVISFFTRVAFYFLFLKCFK